MTSSENQVFGVPDRLLCIKVITALLVPQITSNLSANGSTLQCKQLLLLLLQTISYFGTFELHVPTTITFQLINYSNHGIFFLRHSSTLRQLLCYNFILRLYFTIKFTSLQNP